MFAVGFLCNVEHKDCSYAEHNRVQRMVNGGQFWQAVVCRDCMVQGERRYVCCIDEEYSRRK